MASKSRLRRAKFCGIVQDSLRFGRGESRLYTEMWISYPRKAENLARIGLRSAENSLVGPVTVICSCPGKFAAPFVFHTTFFEEDNVRSTNLPRCYNKFFCRSAALRADMTTSQTVPARTILDIERHDFVRSAALRADIRYGECPQSCGC